MMAFDQASTWRTYPDPWAVERGRQYANGVLKASGSNMVHVVVQEGRDPIFYTRDHHYHGREMG